ncbi:MAG: spermidine/putrescine ABC transporter substrate-binding protein [Oscillospiraceae bacterium]|nr:spermidine/putrescine ABC transporter substrate-binding protein [Oscillospiraceae bacterium]
MNRLRKSLSFMLTLVVLFSVLALCSVSASAKTSEDYPIDEEYYKNNPYRGTTINVYNWGEYISDGSEDSVDVIKEFENLTGIKVNYTNFDSNEDMYAKIKSGGANYDVICPSDYMIDRLRVEGLLEKLDYSNIPNFKYIDEKYKGLYFDENNEYTVTYNVGYVALIYNKTMVEEAPDSWGALWDEQYSGNILMFNNPRDAFALSQLLLGQSLNTEDPEEWALAYDKLLEQKSVVRAYVMDEVFNIMESGAAALAPYYVGDFLAMQENNEDLEICFPKEGANIFVDSLCVPTTTQNKGAAELFINFMQEPQIALANAEYICYATPNTAVRWMEDYSYVDSEILYPDESVTENYEYFYNLPPEIQTLMSNYWGDLKIDGDSNISVYVGLGVFAALGIAGGAYYFIKKKRREKYYD